MTTTPGPGQRWATEAGSLTSEQAANIALSVWTSDLLWQQMISFLGSFFRFLKEKYNFFQFFLQEFLHTFCNLGPDCEEIKCLLKTGGSLPGSRSITMDCLENSWKYFIFTQGPGSISNIIAGEIKYLLECTTPGPVLIIYWLDAFLQCLCLCSGSHSFLSLRSEIVMHFSLFTYSK